MQRPQSSLRLLVVAMAACLVFCVILALDLIPGLRGDFGWRWPYAVPEWSRLLPAILCIAIYLMGAFRIRHTGLFLLWCFAGGIAIPVACLFVTGDPLYQLATRTFSGLATGAHMAGTEITYLGTTLRNWPQIMLTYLEPGQHSMLSVHIRLSPPGLPLFYYGLDQILGALPPIADPLGMALRPLQCQNYAIMNYSNAQLGSALFGILMPVWAGLTLFPLYRAGGRSAAMWWPLVPAVSMFTPTWNTFYPLLGLSAFLLLRRGLSADKARSWSVRDLVKVIVSGLLVSMATFANISTIPLIALFGLYTCLACFQAQQRGLLTTKSALQRAVLSGVAFGVGLFGIWGLYTLASGVLPTTILSQALNQHLELDRPYLPWIYLHLYDLALFAGIPLIFIALLPLVRIAGKPIRQWVDPKTFDPLVLALAITLIVLALSGTARGETGRVWLFFVPFVLIIASRVLEKTDGARLVSAIRLVTVTQAIVLLTLVGFLRVMGTELNPPPDGPPVVLTATDSLPSPAVFAGRFTLVGEKGVARGDGIDLTLTWQTNDQSAIPYYFSALLIGPDGNPIPPTNNWQPFDNGYPTTCWKPGQIITETRHLSLGGHPASGNYWISLSAFDVRDGKGVTVARPESPPDTQIGLGPIPVP